MSEVADQARTYQLGTSRPPLAVDDLPEPEEVFGVRRLGPAQIVKFAIGPSLIALGISIGSGEWLLGPQAVGQYGFVGVGWVILVSAVLQTFYNVEIARYVMATGEAPVVGWGRVPPGFLLWVPLSVFIVIFAFIAGGWAAVRRAGRVRAGARRGGAGRRRGAAAVGDRAAGRGLPDHRRGPAHQPDAGAGQLGHGRRDPGQPACSSTCSSSRSSCGGRASAGFVTPAAPPAGITATQLGGLAGFTALASGLNWYVMGHYRDKGYGMGYRTGYISGLRGERTRAARRSASRSRTTRPTPARWQRWYRLLLIDMWGVFFIGAMLGMLLPTILMAHAVELSGTQADDGHRADVRGRRCWTQEYGRSMFYVALVLGVLILFSTQLGIFEGDGAGDHGRRPRAPARGCAGCIEGDPRRFYYPFMLLLLVIISVILHLALPVNLVQWSANMSNLGALIYPFMLMYLNSKLPTAGPAAAVALRAAAC